MKTDRKTRRQASPIVKRKQPKARKQPPTATIAQRQPPAVLPTARRQQRKPYQRRKARMVKPHQGSGSWVVCIGKAADKKGERLRRKDFYFAGMTEAEANARARRIQAKWDFIVAKWRTMYQPHLEILRSPFAAIPHWQPQLAQKEQTPQDIADNQDRPPTAAEIANAYEDITLQSVFGLFKEQQKVAVAQGDKQNVTASAVEKNIRYGLKAFPAGLAMQDLSHETIQAAKSALLAKYSRRTVKNCLGSIRTMLKWFYGSDYGGRHSKPSGFDSVFSIRNATTTNITVYSPAQLKTLLSDMDDWRTLHCLLALNCGMYQADIGRLTLAEINLKEGHIFWDREKEPENPFKVCHQLWPETRRLVEQFIQKPHRTKRTFTDYRSGKAEEIDCSALAFVDEQGNPLYRVLPDGSIYDKIGQAFQRFKKDMADTYRFHDLRKTTNQFLAENIEQQIQPGDMSALQAASEISQLFLGQRNNVLMRLYRQTGIKLYGRMNHYLAIVGEQLREAGVFSKGK